MPSMRSSTPGAPTLLRDPTREGVTMAGLGAAALGNEAPAAASVAGAGAACWLEAVGAGLLGNEAPAVAAAAGGSGAAVAGQLGNEAPAVAMVAAGSLGEDAALVGDAGDHSGSSLSEAESSRDTKMVPGVPQ